MIQSIPASGGARPTAQALRTRAPESDERLARRVCGEDGQAAFARLYERYHQQLYRYCRSIVRDEYDAQDALQSAMAGAFAALSRGEREIAVRPWLFRIAHNEAVSLLRRRRPQEVSADEQELAAEPSAADPAAIVEQRERFSTLLADLRNLTARQRSVLLMRELSGLSTQEIAAALSSTPGAVKQTLFESRAALRDQEEGRSMGCEQARSVILEDDGRMLRGRRMRSHIRRCAGCRELAEGISTRRADLLALAPPLPALAASALLSRLLDAGTGVVGTASGSAGGVAAGAGQTAAGAGGSAASSGGVTVGGVASGAIAHAGGALVVKALVTAAVIAAGATAAGVTLSDTTDLHHPLSRATPARSHANPRAAAARSGAHRARRHGGAVASGRVPARRATPRDGGGRAGGAGGAGGSSG
ncbi:MAG: RNA polymerase sigma factor, partial [Solirubrobacteraceae bacterium]